MQLANYDKFIHEQKQYFENNLYKPMDKTWDDEYWLNGKEGASWLKARGKASINFNSITRIKGLSNLDVSQNYQFFCKAILIYSYRQANGKASPQKLQAELLVLKRWYYSLKELTGTTDAINLSTDILHHAFNILKENSEPVNLPDHAGTFKRLQDIVNKNGFTTKKLEFDIEIKYINKQNRTPKARITKELIENTEIDEDKINADKLISIQTFINITSLKNLCQNDGERILLNFLFLSIITGFRSTETILLQKDCLIEKPIKDPTTQEPIFINNKPLVSLGIQYYGAKGAGKRIHWVEPSSINLVRSIINEVIELTESYREQLRYIRNKNLRDFLPKAIDEIPNNLIELDDLIEPLFLSKQRNRGRGGNRDAILKSFKSAGIIPSKTNSNGQGELKYYSKATLNHFIKSIANYDIDTPIDYIFSYEGKSIDIPFEDLLFLTQYGATNLSRSLINKTNIVPLDIHSINNFLGAGKNKSVFDKYELLDETNKVSSLSSHIPRHNINTFLAIAEISDHLQAMLMGRVDIEQNKHYQHLSIKQLSVKAGLNAVIKQAQTISESTAISEPIMPITNPIKSPIDAILDYGLMVFSKEKDLDNNFKNNLHTFDNKQEVANFIGSATNDNYFDDILRAFSDLAPTDSNKAKDLIETHAYLYPLPFGSCMRNIATHGCPKRLACQSGVSCVNFTVTGRMGELDNLVATKNKLTQQAHSIAEDSEFGKKINEQIQNLENFEQKIVTSYVSKIPIKIFDVIDTELSQPKTLAQLFTIEYEKLKQADEEENKC